MLAKCQNCGFWINSEEAYCLNCGIREPLQDHRAISDTARLFDRIIRSPFISLLFSFGITFILFYLIAGLSDRSVQYQTYIQFAALVIWLAAASALFLFLRRLQAIKRRKDPDKTGENLTSRSRLIERRISELEERSRNIDKVLKRISDNDPEHLRDARTKLISAREIVEIQISRYKVQESRIALVRLQNGIQPYIYGLETLNEFQAERGLSAIDSAGTEMRRIEDSLNNEGGPGPAEDAALKTQIAQTRESCEKLRLGLLGRQATNAIKKLGTAAGALPDRLDTESEHLVETFNLQASLTDFSESFDELEQEYLRLRAEDGGEITFQS